MVTKKQISAEKMDVPSLRRKFHEKINLYAECFNDPPLVLHLLGYEYFRPILNMLGGGALELNNSYDEIDKHFQKPIPREKCPTRVLLSIRIENE